MHIETARLNIREFIMNDWIDVHKYASSPRVTEHTLWGPNSEEETKSYVSHQIAMQQLNERTDYEFAVILKETNQLIGGCGMYIREKNAEIGYCFNSEYWGNGYASEASKVLLKLAFENFNIHRVFATCRPENTGSEKVLRKIGMKMEGHLREHIWAKGVFHDSYLFSILENEYKERVEPFGSRSNS
ncbi:GNAT family N-acetyltransferase [Paenibacillus sp. FSL H7-0326]|uniref:GNAT family N-acetyltransferase n=1 Tax=Paenibacillus sp. FSL H7-0326 TaxID=1921144 RepID=UPI00096E8DCB|nr:GNAT family N-acetyltransferase [Paenibacillus sp. FSL H7-0326]OMC71762.1 GNAT family N-acetyltransferase [Paenibacillus sp. FSL H7-0326]